MVSSEKSHRNPAPEADFQVGASGRRASLQMGHRRSIPNTAAGGALTSVFMESLQARGKGVMMGPVVNAIKSFKINNCWVYGMGTWECRTYK